MNTLTSLQATNESNYEGAMGVLVVEKILYAGKDCRQVDVSKNSSIAVSFESSNEEIIARAKKHYDYNEAFFMENNKELFV